MYFVPFLERLNKIDIVNNKIAKLVLKKATRIAMIEEKIGKSMCMLACWFSVFVKGRFSIVFDLMTYCLIANNVIPIKIMFKAKNITAVFEYK